jgi:hypothetical protein
VQGCTRTMEVYRGQRGGAHDVRTTGGVQNRRDAQNRVCVQDRGKNLVFDRSAGTFTDDATCRVCHGRAGDGGKLWRRCTDM